jgi:LPXTG-motif cell wall-anchored protein
MVGSSYGVAYAADAATGAGIWSYSGNWFAGNVAVAYGNVYLQLDGDLFAINTSDMAELPPADQPAQLPQALIWDVPGCWCDAGPTVANGIVNYSSSSDSVITAADASNGSTLWTSNAEDQSATTSHSVAGGEVVYGGGYFFSYQLPSVPPALPEAQWAPSLPLVGGAIALGGGYIIRRRRRPRLSSSSAG